MISVVIPARDAAAVLPGQLGALARQVGAEPFEVIVADNGAIDTTSEVVDAWRPRFSRLRWVDASARAGVSHARNVGAKACEGDRILFCDADDEADPHWVSELGRQLEDVDAAGGCLDRRRFTDPRRLRPGLSVSTGLTPWPGFLPFAPGANSGVRSDVFRAIGGYDEDLVGGGDDVDFSWRLQLAGYTLAFAPGAVIHYRERNSLWSAAEQFYRYGRQDPVLAARFEAAGMPPSGWRSGVQSWAHLAAHAPRYLRRPSGRAQWVRSVARRTGRLIGTIRTRNVYL